MRAGEAHVWLHRVGEGCADTDMLSAAERRRADAFRTVALRNVYVGAHVALSRILAGYLGADPAALSLSEGAFGKPFLADHPDLHFNLSHSAGWALIGVSRDGPLGVDVEAISTSPPYEVARMVFSQSEQELLEATPAPERAELFYALWTRKEALAKAIGRGLSLNFQELVVCGGVAADVSEASVPPALAGGSPWFLYRLSAVQGAAAALAAPNGALRIVRRALPPEAG